MQAHDKLDNRRLLWHGTNVAVVAAVLKTGLRIMPTASSGSRVGRLSITKVLSLAP
jgi:poly [ADP-ribose] polymerase